MRVTKDMNYKGIEKQAHQYLIGEKHSPLSLQPPVKKNKIKFSRRKLILKQEWKIDIQVLTHENSAERPTPTPIQNRGEPLQNIISKKVKKKENI